MKKHIASLEGKIATSEEATPACSVDYCDDCGDCLACNEAEPCRVSADGKHRWVVYITYYDSDSICTTAFKRAPSPSGSHCRFQNAVDAAILGEDESS